LHVTVGAVAEGHTPALALLEALLAATERPPMPVLAHGQRTSSGKRGVSLKFLCAIRSFYAAHGGLDKFMGDVCKEEGSNTSVCALTAATGLSLAESVLRYAVATGANASTLVGESTTFFSYSWTGTRFTFLSSWTLSFLTPSYTL
jgi:hypothetical protein